ncbi:CoA-transferase [Marinibaculum pumilum]|uniref:CoA-transferase n=1 Tax=Marinibaculum pumilum TaxID=1766165 RepID=A0ABV7LA90_9PROT
MTSSATGRTAAREIMISSIAELLEGCRHVTVGASSPVPGAGALLARRLAPADRPMLISVLGSQAHNMFTNGGVETFDCAAEGRIDAFFLSGGQIDGQGNINLVGIGDYPRTDVRWPGSFGSAFVYFMIPRVILFREEHSRRVFVEKVDFVSAPGTSSPGIHRPGGPYALLTPLCLFDFDRAGRRFRLRSVHPGHTVEEVRDQTGFDFDCPAEVPVTPAPDPQRLAMIRGDVMDEIAETYPRFSAEMRAALSA